MDLNEDFDLVDERGPFGSQIEAESAKPNFEPDVGHHDPMNIIQVVDLIEGAEELYGFIKHQGQPSKLCGKNNQRRLPW